MPLVNEVFAFDVVTILDINAYLCNYIIWGYFYICICVHVNNVHSELGLDDDAFAGGFDVF